MSGRKPRKTYRADILKMMMLASFFTFFIGGAFWGIQALGEAIGFSPVLTIGTLDWGESGDHIIVFVVVLLFSIWISTFISLMFIRKYIKKF